MVLWKLVKSALNQAALSAISIWAFYKLWIRQCLQRFDVMCQWV